MSPAARSINISGIYLVVLGIVLLAAPKPTRGDSNGPGPEFHQQMKELQEFVEFGIKVSDTISSMKHASALQWAM